MALVANVAMQMARVPSQAEYSELETKLLTDEFSVILWDIRLGQHVWKK